MPAGWKRRWKRAWATAACSATCSTSRPARISSQAIRRGCRRADGAGADRPALGRRRRHAARAASTTRRTSCAWRWRRRWPAAPAWCRCCCPAPTCRPRPSLPAPLQALARRNALSLGDTHWDADIDRLVASIGLHAAAARLALGAGRRAAGRGAGGRLVHAAHRSTAPPPPPDAGERLIGVWMAPVRYSWGDRLRQSASSSSAMPANSPARPASWATRAPSRSCRSTGPTCISRRTAPAR